MRPVRNSLARAVAATLFLGMLALAPTGPVLAEPVLVEQAAAGDFETVSGRIQSGLKARKMAIVRQIHFQDMLEAVGVSSEPAITYETFHPRFGKIVYANDTAAFIELPLRIHVRETDTGVVVQYRTPSSIFAPYNGLTEMGAQLDAIFADVVGEAVR